MSVTNHESMLCYIPEARTSFLYYLFLFLLIYMYVLQKYFYQILPLPVLWYVGVTGLSRTIRKYASISSKFHEIRVHGFKIWSFAIKWTVANSTFDRYLQHTQKNNIPHYRFEMGHSTSNHDLAIGYPHCTFVTTFISSRQQLRQLLNLSKPSGNFTYRQV
jgi:hypothetical protein